MITQYDKAIAALLVGLIALILARFGIKLDAVTEAQVLVLITGIVVYLVPNKTT